MSAQDALRLLAFAVLFFGIFLVGPQPSPGPEIGPRYYAVRSSWSKVLCRQQVPSLAPAVRTATAELAGLFVQSRRDETTDRFLAACVSKSWTARLGFGFRRRISAVLQLFSWNSYDANAYFDLIHLFVASRSQLAALLHKASLGATPPQTLLDIGANTGSATAEVASALGVSASRVTAVENSVPLRARLAARGYRAVASLDDVAGSKYDAVALLNVMDRCDAPRALLRAAANMLAPNGLMIVESVVPFCPRVYKGAWGLLDAHQPPASPLNVSSAYRCLGGKHGFTSRQTFELSSAAFVAAALEGLELEVVSWTRLPYLISGNGIHSHFVLDAALFVLRRPRAPAASAKVDRRRDDLCVGLREP